MSAMTDHRPTLTGFQLGQRHQGLKSIYRRNFKSISTTALCWAINAEALSKVFGMTDVEEIHEIIVREIICALNIVAPLEQVQVKERRNPIYLSVETRSLIMERDRAAASGNHTKYRKLRNKTAKSVRRDKLASNVRILQEQGFNPKSVWQLANAASGRTQVSKLPGELQDGAAGRCVRGDAELADCVNQFYIDKINKIRARIDAEEGRREWREREVRREQQQQEQHQQQHHFTFRAPSEKVVMTIIQGLSNTAALGVDGVPVAVLKQLAPIIAGPISHLVRMSFEQAVVPAGFKKAIVLPLHKKNKPPHLPSSYRPVSILAAMSKIMERVVLRQVSTHLAPLLPPTQFGFRPKRSTASAIAYAHGSWSAAKARDLVVAVAGYDLSSAFDTIDVGMVTSKLEQFGVMGREKDWFFDYLSGREQQVQYNSTCSTFRAVKHGVPQGSILGPLLFLVLVADLPDRIFRSSGNSNNSNNSIYRGGDVEVGFSAYADDALCWRAETRRWWLPSSSSSRPSSWTTPATTTSPSTNRRRKCSGHRPEAAPSWSAPAR